MTAPALRAFEYHWLNYRRVWRGTAFYSFINPTLFLAAMGLGLGSLVDSGDQQSSLGGVSYAAFLAPGLLAASAMQLATSESMWPVMAAMKWQRTYFAQTATPLEPADAARGHLLFIAFRALLTAAVFTVVMVLFRATESPWLVLAVPAAALCAMAHAAPITAFAAAQERETSAFPSLNRFVIIPMFLFSGTFFPVSQLPAVLRPVAWFTPLWHGVQLCRTLSLGTATVPGVIGHTAYLVAWTAAGVWAAVVVFRRRLSR